MKIIGITGGIGCGKSAVLNILKKNKGSFVIEADVLAHKLMEQGCPAYDEIVAFFGNEILKEDKSIDRGVLGGLVFDNNIYLKRLNEIVHPAVKMYILSDIEEKRQEGFDYYIIEAALLIEDGYKNICDEIWYIYADRDSRIERLIKARGGDKAKWEGIIRNQSDEDYYRDNCDYVVDNGKDLAKTECIVNELLCKK